MLEHNGDVYSCDHCVYPQSRLGNVLKDSLLEMAGRSAKTGLGAAKEASLSRWYRECKVLPACRGGCPKHRFARTPYGEPGLYYLCAGYSKFFMHIRIYLKAMGTLLENGLPASYIMEAVKGPLVIKLDNGPV